jgi:glycoprotein endo-alpha-1,2-mannosidase
MRRRALTVLAVVLLLAAAPAAEARVRSAIFYYPWYGVPARDGAYQHWHQNGMRPPRAIASSFYPARGVYSSGDRLVVAAQMADIRAAGIDQVIASWWGRDSVEDRRLPMLVAAARKRGLSVAAHVEPYPGRTSAAVEADLAHLRALGIRDVYVYRPDEIPAGEWAAVNERVADMRLFAETGLVGIGRAGRFAGVYTYDILTFGPAKLARYCEQARRAGLLCAPSVGPGYHARRAVGDRRVRLRRGGRTYDAMWRAALRAGADVVTITSYNEWHEGTQIEPARRRTSAGGPRYLDYEGAWGRTGAAAERAYLERTAFWTSRLRARAR